MADDSWKIAYVAMVGVARLCEGAARGVCSPAHLFLDVLGLGRLCLRTDRFTPVTAAGMTVWVGDGLKAPKEGRKMPAVKKLHQQSANNSKPEYIFGHSFQAIGLLVTDVLGTVFAVPVSSRIHEEVAPGP